MAKFRALAAAPSTEVAYMDEPKKLPAATLTQSVEVEDDGFLARMETIHIGRARPLGRSHRSIS
ncbi:MAG TPA: hypothetical protein QGI62_07995 [Anaerolineales bacterium]|nr:hypothetical protein [Anaerolineales bacterium]